MKHNSANFARAALIVVILYHMLPSLAASQSVGGVVIDEFTAEPIADVLIVLFDTSGLEFVRRRTDVTGAFTIPVVAVQRFQLWASRTGYEQVLSGSLEARPGMPPLEVRLTPKPMQLEPLSVRVESQTLRLSGTGFYERKRTGIGRFITAESIEDRRASTISEVLTMEPSVRTLIDFYGDGGTGTIVTFRGTVRGGEGIGLRPCLPTLVLDGVRVRDSGMLPDPRYDARRPIRVDELIHPSNVAAIELYPSGNGAPVQWSGMDAGCGLVVIWTKQRKP